MGLSPYEKKSYKDSKRRRRQALLADETGRIVPYRRRGKAALLISIAVLSVAALALGVLALIHLTSDSPDESRAKETELSQSEELLRIVNRQKPLERSYVPELEDFDGFKVSALAFDSLQLMTEDARGQGIELKLRSAYVSFDEQESRYQSTLGEYLSNPDYSEVRAKAAAQKAVAPGGCSEAQTGLLFDFDVSSPDALSFLERNCVKYGFILRYPEDKEDITHCTASNSLYRYVGSDNAIKLRSYIMCLEEYAEYLGID